jgi:hypothetical protein
VHADTAAGGDKDIAIVEWIGELGQAAIGSWRGLIELGRTLHGQGLVGPLGVELCQEGIEAGLLLKSVHAGRPGCLLLEGEVHAPHGGHSAADGLV